MSQTILIVDDEVYVRLLLEQTLEDLEDEGISIELANDGVQGLEAAKRLKPDLIFLDIMMPGMNGIDVCRAIKDDPGLEETKIVLLTAKGQEADKVQGLDAGAIHYIAKPFTPDEVLSLARTELEL